MFSSSLAEPSDVCQVAKPPNKKQLCNVVTIVLMCNMKVFRGDCRLLHFLQLQLRCEQYQGLSGRCKSTWMSWSLGPQSCYCSHVKSAGHAGFFGSTTIHQKRPRADRQLNKDKIAFMVWNLVTCNKSGWTCQG